MTQARNLILTCLLLGTAGVGRCADYYVDFQNGSDSNLGTQASPWQHAPGDYGISNTSNPSKASFAASNNHIFFKGGVVYGGSIQLKPNISYVGNQWGAANAIYDNSVPITSSAACGTIQGDPCQSNPNWQNLRTSLLTGSRTWTDWVFTKSSAMSASQYPVTTGQPTDIYNINLYAQVGSANDTAFTNGTLNNAPSVGPGALLAYWSASNTVNIVPINSYNSATATITFTVPSVTTGAQPRPSGNVYAIINDVSKISGPGQFALYNNTLYYWPTQNASETYSIGGNQSGFQGQSSISNVAISGFLFQKFSSASGTNGIRQAPVSLPSTGASYDHILIDNNVFINSSMVNEQGFVTATSVTNLTVSRNSFANTIFASGVRLINAFGPITVTCNNFSNLARTAVYEANIFQSTVNYNILQNIQGIHANGITLYYDNRNSIVQNNLITATLRPITFQNGDTAYAAFPAIASSPESYLFDQNVLQQPPNTQIPVNRFIGFGALYDYGGMSGVTVSSNIFTPGGSKSYAIGNPTGDTFTQTGNNLSGTTQDEVNKQGAIASYCSTYTPS